MNIKKSQDIYTIGRLNGAGILGQIPEIKKADLRSTGTFDNLLVND